METPITFDAPPHKLWTREECEALGRAGVLELERYELICGEVVLKMSRSQPQMLAKALLAGWLHSVYGGLQVLSEPSIDLRPEDNLTNDPVPDLIVLNRSVRELSARPRPEELWLVTEVSDTSLDSYIFNRKQKYFNKSQAASSSWMMLRMDASAL